MDIRDNGLFYRNAGKTTSTPADIAAESSFEIKTTAPATASSKILVSAYKDLMQHFNQLDTRTKNKWQLEINVIARQLAHLFKQTAKNANYSGYPALSLLREIKQLDEKLAATSAKKTTESMS